MHPKLKSIKKDFLLNTTLKKLKTNIVMFYAVKEHEEIQEFYSRILKQKYYSLTELLESIEELVIKTRINLKTLKIQDKKNITIICSCCSALNKESNEESTKASKILADNKRKEKRENKESCKFRILFKYNKLENSYSFNKLTPHNHGPKCTESDFVRLSKNIKFSLKDISLIIKNISDSIIILDYDEKEIRNKTDCNNEKNLDSCVVVTKNCYFNNKHLQHFKKEFFKSLSELYNKFNNTENENSEVSIDSNNRSLSSNSNTEIQNGRNENDMQENVLYKYEELCGFCSKRKINKRLAQCINNNISIFSKRLSNEINNDKFKENNKVERSRLSDISKVMKNAVDSINHTICYNDSFTLNNNNHVYNYINFILNNSNISIDNNLNEIYSYFNVGKNSFATHIPYTGYLSSQIYEDYKGNDNDNHDDKINNLALYPQDSNSYGIFEKASNKSLKSFNLKKEISNNSYYYNIIQNNNTYNSCDKNDCYNFFNKKKLHDLELTLKESGENSINLNNIKTIRASPSINSINSICISNIISNTANKRKEVNSNQISNIIDKNIQENNNDPNYKKASITKSTSNFSIICKNSTDFIILNTDNNKDNYINITNNHTINEHQGEIPYSTKSTATLNILNIHKSANLEKQCTCKFNSQRNLLKSDKAYSISFKKKFSSFLDRISKAMINKIKKANDVSYISRLTKKSFIYNEIITVIIEMGANYLSIDNCYLLKRKFIVENLFLNALLPDLILEVMNVGCLDVDCDNNGNKIKNNVDTNINNNIQVIKDNFSLSSVNSIDSNNNDYDGSSLIINEEEKLIGFKR